MVVQTALYKYVKGSRPIVDDETMMIDSKNVVDRISSGSITEGQRALETTMGGNSAIVKRSRLNLEKEELGLATVPSWRSSMVT